VLAALIVAGSGRADPGLLIGVADDRIKWSSDSAAVLRPVRSLGLDAIRITLPWRPGKRHLNRVDHTALRRALTANQHGTRVVLAVYGSASDAPQDDAAREDYCRYVRNLLLRYREIDDVVIWNEANSPTFWQPQEGAASAYAALLARCWDLIHAARPEANVITTTAPRWDPAEFIGTLGAAYRRSGRAAPIFDTAGHNPYPAHPDEPPWLPHEDGYIGQGDHERLLSALQRAFEGTGQPIDSIWYLEDGFQTAVNPLKSAVYEGRENETRPVSPHVQAAHLAAALRLAYCQSLVGAFFNFQLADEPSLDGWQSGLLWADGSRKPAYGAFGSAIAQVRSGAVECEATASLTERGK
jgi:hypothetical protein